MKILLTNDDGIDAVGLRALAKWAREKGEVTVVAPKVGSMSRFGNELIDGAQIAIDMINENGGLLGDKLNLIAIDDRCEDVFAISTAQMIALNSSKEDI